MGRSRAKSRHQARSKPRKGGKDFSTPSPRPARRWVRWILACVAVAACVTAIVGSTDKSPTPVSTNTQVSPTVHLPEPLVKPIASSSEPLEVKTTFELEPKTLDELLAIPEADLHKVDIARMNLLCATGLPGAETMDVEALLDRLDEWSSKIARYTENSLPDFQRRPQDFKNSEAKFRTLLVFSVLQREFGVHYQDDGLDVNYQSAAYPLILGMMTGEAGGNCASMPVMYTAVGRRLGYPMSLLLGKTHIFARWDGTDQAQHKTLPSGYRDRFNIEGTSEYFNTYSDDFYRGWPYPISEAEIAEGWYLNPLDAVEELAVFLYIRGTVLLDNGLYEQAEDAFGHSYRLAPHNREGRLALEIAQNGGVPKHGSQSHPRLVRVGHRQDGPITMRELLDGVHPSRLNPMLAQQEADARRAQEAMEANRRHFEQQKQMSFPQQHAGYNQQPVTSQFPAFQPPFPPTGVSQGSP